MLVAEAATAVRDPTQRARFDRILVGLTSTGRHVPLPDGDRASVRDLVTSRRNDRTSTTTSEALDGELHNPAICGKPLQCDRSLGNVWFR
ncbi:hypothetical protein [Promicromonospora kroppenstedtii]|uniref:hypothetical protein n=1 Tax=Promicromonospora kroppenstedtii TaxID=440482 RepID=UPI0012F8F94D|nr:hypothetical protein [Promicromonospora kroppenstedtii]